MSREVRRFPARGPLTQPIEQTLEHNAVVRTHAKILLPSANRMWLKRTTAIAPIAPAAKQIAARCITVMVKTPFHYQRSKRAPPATYRM